MWGTPGRIMQNILNSEKGKKKQKNKIPNIKFLKKENIEGEDFEVMC